MKNTTHFPSILTRVRQSGGVVLTLALGALLTTAIPLQAGKGGTKGGGGGGGKGGGGSTNELIPVQAVLDDDHRTLISPNVLLDDTKEAYVDGAQGVQSRIGESNIYLFPSDIYSDLPIERNFHLPLNYLVDSTVTDELVLPQVEVSPGVFEYQIPRARLAVTLDTSPATIVEGPLNFLTMTTGEQSDNVSFVLAFRDGDTPEKLWVIEFGRATPAGYEGQPSDTLSVRKLNDTEWEFWTQTDGLGYLYLVSDGTKKKGKPSDPVFAGQVKIPLSGSVSTNIAP